MAITPLRMLLFLGGASAAAFGTAYTMGAFDPLLAPRAAAVSELPAAQPGPVANAPAVPKPADATTQPAPKLAGDQAALQRDDGAAQPAPLPAPGPPTFDILRVEPDGSVVIAGKAAPATDIEILGAGKVLGKTRTTAGGDFAAVLDEPLKPGDHQLSLRATTQTKMTIDSNETAVVSVPADRDGQVLALVEQPGAASRIIAKPAPPPPAAPQTTAAVPAKPQAAAPPPEPDAAAPGSRPTEPAPAVPVAVEAVEIEGRKVFVAGAAPPGAPVRVYANDQLLGETRATPEGRFLLEAERDLAVGDYQVRADALATDGRNVIARAEVGFSREPGESVAAVVAAPRSDRAPQTDSAAESTQTPPAQNGVQPSAAPPQSPPAQAGAGTAESARPDPAVASAEPGEQLKLQSVSGGVIIRRGDSLWRISRRVYGRGVRYSTIYLANSAQIRDPNRIYPGQIFRVPETTDQGEKADMKTIGDQATTVE